MLAEALRESFVVSVAGGLLSLDRTACFQLMLSRPIVSAPAAGYLLGDVSAGIISGAVLELMFAGDLPVGRYVPMHETSVAVSLTAFVSAAVKMGAASANGAMTGFWGGPALLFFPVALLFSVPVSHACQRADTLARRYNERFFVSAESSLDGGAGAGLFRENLKGAGVFFAFTFAGLLITTLPLLLMFRLLFPYLAKGAPFAFAGSVALGTGAALFAVYTRWSLVIFLLSAMATGLCLMLLGGL